MSQGAEPSRNAFPPKKCRLYRIVRIWLMMLVSHRLLEASCAVRCATITSTSLSSLIVERSRPSRAVSCSSSSHCERSPSCLSSGDACSCVLAWLYHDEVDAYWKHCTTRAINSAEMLKPAAAVLPALCSRRTLSYRCRYRVSSSPAALRPHTRTSIPA